MIDEYIPIKNGWCSWCSTKLPGGLQPVARNFAAYPRFHRPRWRPAYWPWSFGSAFRLFGATSWRKRHPAEGLRVTWVFFLGACRAQWVYPEWGYRWIRWYDCPQCIPILDKRNLCQPYDNGDIMRILSWDLGDNVYNVAVEVVTSEISQNIGFSYGFSTSCWASMWVTCGKWIHIKSTWFIRKNSWLNSGLMTRKYA